MRNSPTIPVLAGLGLLGMTACNTMPSLFFGGAGGNTNSSRAVLPESISLDIGELPDEDDPNAKTKLNADLPAVTPFERTLRAAARTVHNYHRFTDRALALAARINSDITDPAQTQVSGTFFANGQTVSYKADFGQFDIDGDGASDGSGQANATPVALRMWVDRGNTGVYQRFLCSLVTTRPSNSNVGAGQLFVRPAAARADEPGDLQIYVQWDRTDDAHRWNTAVVSGQLRSDLRVRNGRNRVDVRTSDGGGIEKTVRIANRFDANPFGFDTYQSAVHWARGSGAALLSALSTGGNSDVGFNNICINLIDQMLATNGECDAFDTQDMSFIDLPIDGEADFPADFPETPTF